MTSRSSTRSGGGWRTRAALLLLALALSAAAVTAPSARAGSGAYCPTSGYLTLGAGNGCTGTSIAALIRVSFMQNPPIGSRCAVGKETRDPDAFVVIAAVCGAGTGTYGEVYASTSVPQAGFPRGRNDTSVTQNYYFGTYYW